MAIHNTLRVAGGATGVTHACCLILVNDWPLHRSCCCNERFILVYLETRNRCWYFAFAVIHKHKMLHGCECGQQRFNQRIDRCINEDHFIFGVIHDVRNLLGEQTNVQCVQNTPRTGCCEIQLKVPLRIPRKGANASCCRDSKCIQGTTEATRAVCPFTVRNALTTSCCGSNDLLIAVVLFRTIK